jgi:ABC-type multidrug transport system ATPase subunit
LFSNLSIDLPAGITLLDGDTDSGKTTLLRLLASNGCLVGGSGRLFLSDGSGCSAWPERAEKRPPSPGPVTLADPLQQTTYTP